jgi:protein-S-isoprenylcysteine O-methyltransferase Ste14
MGILIGLQWVGLALNFLLAGLFPAAAIPWYRTALFSIGVILILLGVALRWYAIWTLGRYFTRDVAVSADQQVVQTGPYRSIRHPAYSGTFLTMLGVGLAMTNWASLVTLLICVLIGHMYRVSVEEKALIQAIGQPYVEYMHRTRLFIPLVF